MMQDRTVNNPFFNEFVYDILYHTHEDKKNKCLDGQTLKHLRNDGMAKRWLRRATQDEKDLMLAKLGVRFFKVYVPIADYAEERLKKVFLKYQDKTALQMINELIEQHFFIYSDTQILDLFGMMAQACHTNTYLLNRDYSKVAYQLEEWQKDADIVGDRDTREMMEDARNVAKFALHTIITSEFMPDTMGLKNFDIKILLYLFLYKDKLTQDTKIYRTFNGVISEQGVARTLCSLEDEALIERKSSHSKEWRITGRGCQTVHKYLQKIFESINF